MIIILSDILKSKNKDYNEENVSDYIINGLDNYKNLKHSKSYSYSPDKFQGYILESNK